MLARQQRAGLDALDHTRTQLHGEPAAARARGRWGDASP